MGNQKLQRWKAIALALACTSAFVVEAADKFCWEENFRNYSDNAPGIVKGIPGISVGNDPIWVNAAELNVWQQKGDNVKSFVLFDKAIEVPDLKNVNIAFSFRIMNADIPVQAQSEVKDKNGRVTKPAVAAKAGLARKFNVLVNDTVVTIASDSVTINGKTTAMPFMQNWKWEEAALRVKDGKLTVFISTDRKLKQIQEVPFKKGVKTVNFSGSNENGFSISNIKIEENGKLREYPAAKWFADFRSLSQPLVGATKGNLSIPFNNASSRVGVKVVVNKTDKPLEMKVVWDNGMVDSYPITVRGTSDSVTVPMLNQAKNTKIDLPDAIVDIGKTTGQYVRPMMRRFRSSYDAVKQYEDIIRDWSLLPPASKHPLDIDFVAQPDGSVDMLVDGSFINRRRLALDTKGEGIVRAELKKATDELNKQKRANAPAAQLAALQATVNKIQNQLDKMPAAKIKSIEIIGNGVSEVQAKNTDAWKGINPKYYMLDLSSNPRAKAFANAKSSVNEGLNTFDGVPYLVAKPMDSADVAICKEGQGNWGLEVEEYLGRSPIDGFPSAIHFRVPADAYGTAHVICALDPDPNKDAVLTTRMGFYMNNGSGGNLLGDTFIEIKDGKIPENFKQIGTVELKGKKVPLYKVAIKLATGKIIDLAAREKYLDFEFMGKGWENLQQLDNSMKPSPYSDSAFNIFAVTLEKAPAVMDIKQHSPGNVFTADERAVTTVALKAKQNNIKGTIVWTAKDVDGKVQFTGDKGFTLNKIGDTTNVDIPLKAPVGYYDLDIQMKIGKEVVFDHPARFAILAKDTRVANKFTSPYATWWFNAHGSPGEAEYGGPIMQKAGIRKCSWVTPTAEMSEKYNITYTGNLALPRGFGYRDIDLNTGKFKDGTIDLPDPSDPRKKIQKKATGEERFVHELKAQINSKPWLKYDHILIWHETAPGYGIPEELLNMPLPESTKAQIKNDKAMGLFINEVGRIMKKHFPDIRVQIGNSSASIGAATRPIRAGADVKWYDSIGIETPSQVIPPERLSEVGLQGMLIAQEAATTLGKAKKKVPLNGSWEFVYRAERDMGEQLQAEWHMRDVLISLANDFTLISPGILFDCKNGYYNGLWGGSGILQRGPYVYPKRAYVAYANLTRVLDCAKFIRQIPTGSTTVYAMEYKVAGGKTVTALWAARGAVEFELANPSGKALVTDMYGRESNLKGKTAVLKGGTAPVYVTTDKPLTSVKIVGRSFPEEEARAAKTKIATVFDDAAKVTVSPDSDFTSTHTGFLPILKPADFTVATVNDPEKGNSLAVTLPAADKYKSKYITEYTTITLKEPATVPGNPKALGIWVKGNSNWGQIRFTIEDAEGEIFKSLSTGRSWGCDILDWPGNLAVNFDGWSFVGTPLFQTTLFRTHSPGPISEQWVSCGGNKKIDLPIKIRAITVGMNRTQLDLLDFKDVNPTILLNGVGGIEE